MPNITEMNPIEFRELLHTLVNEELFKSRERLAALLAKEGPREALDAEFFHFHGDYVDFAYWLEDYEEDPLEGLTQDTPLVKKLKRQREYVLANRKTTLKERNFRRMGIYLNSDPMPEKKITDLSMEEYRALLRDLVTQDIFPVRERLVVLLDKNPSDKELEVAFREFYVAYELLEGAFEDYHYDPDEGLEFRPEVIERIDQSIAEIEAGTAETISLEEVAKEFGVKLKCTR
ncbi:MAG: hypothetical protein OXN25_04845 [Candidatus Poribacteria bacterium]|nr:hypothetical protein [Candidatus Poribacteria bacterium]